MTVVTVTYNAAKLIRSTIQSVLEQDYKNIEYIIIDGGSTDNTLNIVQEYEQSIDYWQSEPDSGVYDAMNKAIDKASGEWINFMNAGDSFCKKTTLSEVAAHFDQEAELISGGIYYIDGNHREYRPPKDLSALQSSMLCHQSLFTKTHIMKKYKFSLEFKIVSDYDFVLKCYHHHYHFKFLDFAIANFIAGGMAEMNPVRAKIEDMFVQSKYLENPYEIYNLNSYARFESLKKDNNYLFSVFLNKAMNQIDEIKLKYNNIVIYGDSVFAELIADKFTSEVVIVDKNANNIISKYHVIEPGDLNEYVFDCILVAVLGRENNIENYLHYELGIDKGKIKILSI
ncbi:glycosyltransferase family 2 protein [sulfur-oxidizing endosymbiont of Gigantopelta aegis]|uniref:glycosyltransferase family 2 protein n=1 Tax=sulfur-oxidizing endosymbiont of Gigantopelta aegis TaxID=2794934 RepID=UPI001BE4076F|nr:glycosyltransferase family 2 protein [sulfur-oxidizing endosymbiont of Gigantopelta aegis]